MQFFFCWNGLFLRDQMVSETKFLAHTCVICVFCHMFHHFVLFFTLVLRRTFEFLMWFWTEWNGQFMHLHQGTTETLAVLHASRGRTQSVERKHCCQSCWCCTNIFTPRFVNQPLPQKLTTAKCLTAPQNGYVQLWRDQLTIRLCTD